MEDTSTLHLDGITIRPAIEADADIIGILWQKLANHHIYLDDRLPKPASNGAERYANRVRDQLQDSYTRIFVAEHNGVIVGYVLGFITDYMPDVFMAESNGFLADIFVDVAYRSKGVGKALVKALQAWFRTRGIQTMEWYVASENAPAQAFWQHLGGKSVIIRMRVDL